jgi:hypothetical protein
MHLVIENNILEEIVVYQNKRPDASEGKKKRIRKYSLVSQLCVVDGFSVTTSGRHRVDVGGCRNQLAAYYTHDLQLDHPRTEFELDNAASSCILETTPDGWHAVD